MVIYSENGDFKSETIQYEVPSSSGISFKKENFELLICHDGSNRVHCKVKNLRVLFNVVAPKLSNFENINHGILRIVICLNSQ